MILSGLAAASTDERNTQDIKLNEKWDYADLLVQFGIVDNLSQARKDISRAREEHTKIAKYAEEWTEVRILLHFLFINLLLLNRNSN